MSWTDLKEWMLRNYSDLIDFFLPVRTKNQGCMMQLPLESGSCIFRPASSRAEMVTKELPATKAKQTSQEAGFPTIRAIPSDAGNGGKPQIVLAGRAGDRDGLHGSVCWNLEDARPRAGLSCDDRALIGPDVVTGAKRCGGGSSDEKQDGPAH